MEGWADGSITFGNRPLAAPQWAISVIKITRNGSKPSRVIYFIYIHKGMGGAPVRRAIVHTSFSTTEAVDFSLYRLHRLK